MSSTTKPENILEQTTELIRTSKPHRDIYIWGLLRGLQVGNHDVDFVHKTIISLIDDIEK